MDSDDNKPKRGHGLLTPMQNRFVENFDGNATEAARLAGYKNPNMLGPRLMQNKMVAAAIQAKMAIRLEAQAKEEGKAIGKKAAVTKAAVMDRLGDLMNLAPGDTNNNISGQVRAANVLAEILGMKVGPQNPDKFEGFTDSELERYAKDGTVPERFASRFGITPGSSTQVM